MTDKLTRSKLAAKVAWEGGLMNTLAYGIAAADIADPALAAEWGALAIQYQKVEALAEALEGRLQNGLPPVGGRAGHDRYTNDLLRYKIERRDGVLEIIDEVDPKLIADPLVAATWRETREAWRAMLPALKAMDRALHQAD